MRQIEGQYLQTDHSSLHTNLYLYIMHDHSLPYSRLITTAPFNYQNQPRSLLLCAVTQRRLLVTSTYVTGQPIDAIFLDCLTLEDGMNRLPRNVSNYQPTLRNILEERRPHVYRWKSLKLRSLRGVVSEITV